MSDNESSGLSSPPTTDEEISIDVPVKKTKPKKGSIKAFFTKKTRTPSLSPEPERLPSPPHEYVLADHPDIAVLVMFRSRFAEAFPRSVPNIGPQDIENGVVSAEPSDAVERLLCGLLGLVLNRKKDVEKGHYNRALEDAVSSQRSQWPRSWNSTNPIAGSKSFNTMSPTERIDLLKTLAQWSLNSSEVIAATIKESYKQSRHDDDLNQPLSVQPWGMDDNKRRYWLVEGHNDTPFRIYRQNATKENKETWFSVAESIEDAMVLADRMQNENKTQAATRFGKAIRNAEERFKETLEKRKRKEYRQARKAAFSRPESGVSLYEGRTRGKRARYTFDDEDDYGSETSTRKSLRNTSGTATPVDAPTITSSGRQVRSQFGRSYGDTIHLRTDMDARSSEEPVGDGPRRSGRARGAASRTKELYSDESADELGDEEDNVSGEDRDWSGDDNDITGKFDDDDDDDEDMSEADEGVHDSVLANAGPQSRLVVLHYRKGSDGTSELRTPDIPPDQSLVGNGNSSTPNGSATLPLPQSLAPAQASSNQPDGNTINATPLSHQEEMAKADTTLEDDRLQPKPAYAQAEAGPPVPQAPTPAVPQTHLSNGYQHHHDSHSEQPIAPVHDGGVPTSAAPLHPAPPGSKVAPQPPAPFGIGSGIVQPQASASSANTPQG